MKAKDETPPVPASGGMPAANKVAALVHLADSGGISVDYWTTVAAAGLNGVTTAVPKQQSFWIEFRRGVVPLTFEGLPAGEKVESGMALITDEIAARHGLTLAQIVETIKGRTGAYGNRYGFVDDEVAMTRMRPQLFGKWKEEQKGRLSPELVEVFTG